MKKLLIILILAGVVITSFFYFRNRGDRILIERGNEIVQQIEDFNHKEGRLPSSLNEMGIQEDEIFYNKWDSVNYMVWYGTSLGESMTYYSDTKTWEDRQRGFY